MKPPPLISCKRQGFTLVELLLVIIVAAVILALVAGNFPALLEKGRSTRTQSNLRAMGVALAAHVSDNDGKLIDGAIGPTLKTGGLLSSRGPAVYLWFNALDYYLGGEDHTLAGMRRAERPKWQSDPTKVYPVMQSSSGYGVSVGFGWNHQYFGYDANQNPASGTGWATRMATVEAPSRTIIIGTGEDSFNESNLLRNTMIYANSIRCKRHQGRGYYLFLDGHIEALTPEAVMANNSYLMKRQK